MSDPGKEPAAGIVDPESGEPTPRSGPQGGPEDSAAGTVARDVATDGTDEPEDDAGEQPARRRRRSVVRR